MVDSHMRTSRRSVVKTGSAVMGAGLVGSLAGCLGGIGGGGATQVKVGSKRFTEQEILGYLSVESLTANTDHDIVDETSLGGTTTNFEALKAGDIDTYWEYTGTALLTLPPKHDQPIGDPRETYDVVDKDFNEEHNLDFLKRAPFNNTYVLVANKQWSKQTGVKNLSDFAEHVNAGNTDFTIVLNAEFEQRPDGWPGVAKHYGFDGVLDQLKVQNMGSGLIYQALGQGDAQVGIGFNTNPKIIKFDLVALKDNKQFFPVYNPAPLVRKDTLEEAPEIKEPLNQIGPTLTTETIRSLNKRVSIDGEDARGVAKEFLSNEGLI